MAVPLSATCGPAWQHPAQPQVETDNVRLLVVVDEDDGNCYFDGDGDIDTVDLDFGRKVFAHDRDLSIELDIL